jgi:hypothetical protein
MSKNKERVCGVMGAVLAGCLALGGCVTPVDQHVRVADWPALKVVEHRVEEKELRDQCSAFVGPLSSPVGCTVFLFDKGQAHIFVSKDFPSDWALEHERLHAAGHDHVGSTALQSMWQAWNERNPRPQAIAERR